MFCTVSSMLASAWPPFFLDSHHSFLWKQNGVCLSSGKAHLQDRILNTRARNRIALSLSLCLCLLSHTCSPPSPAAGPAKQPDTMASISATAQLTNLSTYKNFRTHQAPSKGQTLYQKSKQCTTDIRALFLSRIPNQAPAPLLLQTH